MNQIQMVITATNQDIFTFLNRKCYLAVATDFRVVTAMRKRRRIVLLLFMTSGRADNVCGNMGTVVIASREGVRIGPPAEREYAVEPVGVEIISPSERCENAKILVDIHFELNHMRYFAVMKYHFVNRRADAFLAILLTDLRFQQNVSR